MIENFIKELMKTLAETGEYKYSENGYDISAKSEDGQLSIQVSYEEPKNLAKEESDKFTEFVKELDDDLFIDVCEELGSATINKISEQIHSNNLEIVNSGIKLFKETLYKILTDRINYYQKCLQTFNI